jgi:hypothetical protein
MTSNELNIFMIYCYLLISVYFLASYTDFYDVLDNYIHEEQIGGSGLTNMITLDPDHIKMTFRNLGFVKDAWDCIVSQTS